MVRYPAKPVSIDISILSFIITKAVFFVYDQPDTSSGNCFSLSGQVVLTALF